jgi:hypothetical protein
MMRLTQVNDRSRSIGTWQDDLCRRAKMAFETKVKRLWAMLAIPGVLLGIGASYEHGGLGGLRDLTLDTLRSAGFYQEAPARNTSNLPLQDSGTSKPSDNLAADEIFWLSIKEASAPSLFDEFLKKFPNSPHAREARAKLEELERVRSVRIQRQSRMPMRAQGRGPMMMPPNAQEPPPNGGG